MKIVLSEAIKLDFSIFGDSTPQTAEKIELLHRDVSYRIGYGRDAI